MEQRAGGARGTPAATRPCSRRAYADLAQSSLRGRRRLRPRPTRRRRDAGRPRHRRTTCCERPRARGALWWRADPGGPGAAARGRPRPADARRAHQPSRHQPRIEWLETDPGRGSVTVHLLVASHDRAFLDNGRRVAIWELRDRRADRRSAAPTRRICVPARVGRCAGALRGRLHRPRPSSARSELVQRYRSQRKHVKMHEHERRLEALGPAASRRPRPSAAEPSPGRPACDRARRRRARPRSCSRSKASLCGYPAGRRPGRGAHHARRAAGGPAGASVSAWSGRTAPASRRCCARSPASCGRSRASCASARTSCPATSRSCATAHFAGLVTVLDSSDRSVAPVTPRCRRVRTWRASSSVAMTCSSPVSELSGGERSRARAGATGSRQRRTCCCSTSPRTTSTSRRARRWRPSCASPRRRSSSSRTTGGCWSRHVSACGWWTAGSRGRRRPSVVPFDRGYVEWRAAVADGWNAADALART